MPAGITHMADRADPVPNRDVAAASTPLWSPDRRRPPTVLTHGRSVVHTLSRSYTQTVNRRRLVTVVALLVLVGVGLVLWPRHHAGGMPSASQQARVTRFARQQAAELGDPTLRQVTLFIGPQTMRATGGPKLGKSEALIILRGHFKCDHCRDATLAGLGLGRSWKATGVEYTVSWPSLGVIAYGSGNGPDPLNLQFTEGIKRALIITM